MLKKSDKLLFGTAGTPLSTPRKGNPIDGIKEIHRLKLDCMQLEFAHGVRMKEDISSALRRLSYELNIPLTSHGPYYINLNAREQDKIDSSIERIIQTAKVSDSCGAASMTFHSAFYMKDSPFDVFDLVEKSMNVIHERLSRLDIDIELRPELTGKNSQFGSLEELLALSKSIPTCKPSLDFAHLYARTGKGNSYEEFIAVLETLEENLGKQSLKELHIHLTGIAVTSKGDLRQIPLDDSKFNWKDLIRALKKKKCAGFVICSSPKLEQDALKMKNYYLSI